MGDVVRADVENKICDQLGPKADSFRLPQQIAYDKMDEVNFCVILCDRLSGRVYHMLRTWEFFPLWLLSSCLAP